MHTDTATIRWFTSRSLRTGSAASRMPEVEAHRTGGIAGVLPNLSNYSEDREDCTAWPRSNLVRDEHFNRVMIDLVNRGEGVLAIAGRSRTIIKEPVLWESLESASVGDPSSRRPWMSGAD